MNVLQPVLTISQLAARDDYRLGEAIVSPSRRAIEGPGGTADVEPRIMQVLTTLADAADQVVTRESLFKSCWGGVFVGDDSLNRAIAGVRRLAENVANGSFQIETVPRTGYRLVGARPEPLPGKGLLQSRFAAGQPGVSRRVVIGGAVAAASAVGAGFLWLKPEAPDPRAAALIADGQRVLREAWPESDKQGVDLFRKAVALDPGNAQAWGLLAVALRNVAEQAPPAETSLAVRDSQAAAQRALQLDPRNGDALAALATLQPEFGKWGETEDRLRRTLALAPDNLTALNHLVMLLQSVGRAQESWDLNEQAARLDPISPVYEFRRALKQWIFGRVAEADLTIDNALQLWPRHPAVWNSRLYIFAFTGRPDAAAALIRDRASRPRTFTPAAETLWMTSLRALDSRSEADIVEAARANVEASPRSPGFAVSAIMILSMLGRIDDAFSVAEGFLLRRGPLVGTLWTGGGQMPVNDQHRRRTMNLFTPATAAMRSDPRFADLCDGIGLTSYWRSRRVRPDPMFRFV